MQLNLGPAEEPESPLIKSFTPGEMNSANKKINMKHAASKTTRAGEQADHAKRKTVPNQAPLSNLAPK